MNLSLGRACTHRTMPLRCLRSFTLLASAATLTARHFAVYARSLVGITASMPLAECGDSLICWHVGARGAGADAEPVVARVVCVACARGPGDAVTFHAARFACCAGAA